MMKKWGCLILSLLLLTQLCACSLSASKIQSPADSSSSVNADLVKTPFDIDAMYWSRNLPIMDGSTSLIPLEAGIRAALFGIPQAEAALQVSHSSTWGSFSNLLAGSVDLIFSCPLSSSQYDQAEEQGVELVEVPIAKEGFVFVVNAQNPVESLTQEQLRDIYAGRITNWSEVGGLDEPIIAYQRNSDSGSQNYMTSFMGEVALMDAPKELRPGSMVGLMNVIAYNDNARNSIGYSVYAYAADMYGNGDEIKFIQVDGVAPSKQTMSSGEYPLMGINYAIFNADQPDNSPVRKLAEWMVSADGQTAIAQAGYVTVTDIGYAYTEAVLDRYDAIGTGPEVPDNFASYEFNLFAQGPDGILPATVDKTPDGELTYRITQLANTAVQDEINTFIDEQMANARSEYQNYLNYIDTLNPKYTEFQQYTVGPGFEEYNSTYNSDLPASVRVTCVNGYLSVAVAMCYTVHQQGSKNCVYWAETSTWDLFTGERLSPEDLFYAGVGIDQLLNDYIEKFGAEPRDPMTRHSLKSDFMELTLSGWDITCDGIYLDRSNPYFTHGIYVPLNKLPDGTMVTQSPRDFTDQFTDGSNQVCKKFRSGNLAIRYEYLSDTISCAFLDEDAHPHAAAINGTVRNFILDFIPEDYTDAVDWYFSNLGNRYLVFRPSYKGSQNYNYVVLIFDLNTGRQISWTDLLAPGWETLLPESSPDYTQLTPTMISSVFGYELTIRFENDSITVPSEYIAW